MELETASSATSPEPSDWRLAEIEWPDERA